MHRGEHLQWAGEAVDRDVDQLRVADEVAGDDPAGLGAFTRPFGEAEVVGADADGCRRAFGDPRGGEGAEQRCHPAAAADGLDFVELGEEAGDEERGGVSVKFLRRAGELSINSNITNLSRGENDPFTLVGTTYYHGLAGTFTRASSGVEWKKESVLPFGQLLKTFASVRGDAYFLDPTAAPPGFTTDADAYRFMPAVGAEWRWPFLMAAGSTTHVIEPIAQIIVRPNETMIGQLPNEDAQSLVFDDTVLFDVDKFSGYDRIEGGTRLNAGLRYTGNFSDYVAVNALFGQSYHLAGLNSFATPDLADTGAFSGLETNISDYVGSVAVDFGSDARIAARGRFDEKDFAVNRAEIEATKVTGPVTMSAAYIYLRKDLQPDDGDDSSIEETQGVNASASVRVFDNWRVFGALSYNLTGAAIASNSLGLAYDDECLSLSIAYSEAYGTDIPTRKLAFYINFRTLGDTNINADVTSLASSN